MLSTSTCSSTRATCSATARSCWLSRVTTARDVGDRRKLPDEARLGAVEHGVVRREEELETVPVRGVVAGGDRHRAMSLERPERELNGRRGCHVRVHDPHARIR